MAKPHISVVNGLKGATYIGPFFVFIKDTLYPTNLKSKDCTISARPKLATAIQIRNHLNIYKPENRAYIQIRYVCTI